MLRAMSTYVFVKDRLHPGLLQKLAQGGAQAIEIFGARGHFDYANKQHVKEIAGWTERLTDALRESAGAVGLPLAAASV